MKNRSLSVLSVAITAAALLAFAPSDALAHEKDMKMGPQELMTQQLTGLAGQEGAGQEGKVIRFRVPAGWTPPNHVHPGHVFLYMIKGSVTVKHEDGSEKIIGPGETIYEKPGTTMASGSVYSKNGAEFLVFNVGAAGEPVMKMLK